MKNIGCIISQSERPDSNRRLTLQWAHAPSRLEKRSVVMTLRITPTAVIVPLPITFTKERMKTLRDPAKQESSFADRNRRTRTFAALIVSRSSR